MNRSAEASRSVLRTKRARVARREATRGARTFDVSRDGKRFLMIKDDTADPDSSDDALVVVLNLFDEVKRLAPAKH